MDYNFPDKIPCICKGKFINKTNSDLHEENVSVFHQYHKCDKCGVVLHFTEHFFRIYTQSVVNFS